MAERRSYGQACPIAHALDMIGERWALLVVRELRLGQRRYADLAAALPDIGPSVLTQRLRDLERVGVLRRRTLPPPAAAKVYELTPWGAELEPVFAALRRWGMRSPVVPLAGEVSADTVFLGLRAYFNGDAGAPWSATYRVQLERDVYHLVVVDGALSDVRRGEYPGEPDARVTTDQHTLQAVLRRERSLADAVEAGVLAVDGDVQAVRRLVDAASTPA
ncbi:winged helix-turn-helix transcriptional regulator [Streptomyces sp. LHD-70]|uniref:winged helix-turn-helix transcriptional regulator n=1 Tax=Streptomyces sp. LHD-70 TaxID=3072140 RepID=UPI00280CFED4|nr:winged helix-turn-helix transcriptional regulator [Streptomyces sp. LHD-70]MDQ8707914.1 winged helix-turn-helix transcriptional regulator [Streptomyces sp. LHD-70]